jgi:hypothetical protein
MGIGNGHPGGGDGDSKIHRIYDMPHWTSPDAMLHTELRASWRILPARGPSGVDWLTLEGIMKISARRVALAAGAVAVVACAWSFRTTAASSVFDGSSLKGWHTMGPAKWRVERGEIVGSAGAAPGWLVLDRAYEDVGVKFAFRCRNCETGVLVRGAKAGDGIEGSYLSLAGPDAGSMFRLDLNAQGQETDRKLLGQPKGQTNTPVQFTLKPDGWNEADLFVSGNEILGYFNDGRIREFAFGGAKLGEKSRYGMLALRIAGGAGAEVRIKDISVSDLTERQALPTEVTDRNFREHKLTDMFFSEGIAVGDINHDGIPDIVSGPYYYPGPDYTAAHEIYPPKPLNPVSPPYPESMLNYVYDFNGDGWPDYLKVGLSAAWLYINPRGEMRHWDEYKVLDLQTESTQLVDLDGDGHPEFIMAVGRQEGYARPDWSDVTKPWTFHPVSEKGDWGGHASGYGDLNGDGRIDILQGSGWWEQPPAGSTALWKFHPVPFGASATVSFLRGGDLLVYDVNGDGLPDVIGSLEAHGPGLVWWEQKRDSRGEITFNRHTIMGDPAVPLGERQSWEETDKSVAFTELHALALADFDGDGVADVVTGKRWWSHGDNYGSKDAQAPPVLYWFRLVRQPGGKVAFEPHLLNNNSGVGVQIVAADVNGDGRPDILAAARKGAFVFINQFPKR